ncbi:MAG: hypothetical protein ACM3XR_10220 [Bacillota bacterium]
MDKLKNKLADIFTYPARYYQSLSDKKATLFAGIIMVGAIDLFIPDIAAVFEILFSGKSADDIRFNALMTVFVILVLGIIDVVFLSVPLFDIFKFLKKKEMAMGQHSGNDAYYSLPSSFPTGQDIWERWDKRPSLVKVMKIYIISHFIIIPVSTFIYFAFERNITETSPAWMQNLYALIFALTYVWFAAIITRGINVIFRFNPLFKRLTYLIVLIWIFIFSTVFSMQIMKWMLMLFRR